MRDDDARGDVEAFHQVCTPTSNFRRRDPRGGEFHRRLRMTLGWMCTVYCSVDILLLVTLRMALNQTHERGSKAQVHDVRVSLLAFSAEGLERPVPPQNAEYRCCYCVLYLARAFMLTFTRSALLWRAGTVLVRLQEGRGVVVRFAFAGVAAASDRAARAAPAEHAACAVRAVCAEHAACAEHAVCDVRAAAQRVRLSVKDGVMATRVALKAMSAAHVCYVVSAGVLREYAQYLRARRAPCASTLWRQRRSPLLPTSLPWPRQMARA